MLKRKKTINYILYIYLSKYDKVMYYLNYNKIVNTFRVFIYKSFN